MICKACAQGADLIQQKKVTKARIELAHELHEFCDGCDCQHRVELQVEGRSVRT